MSFPDDLREMLAEFDGLTIRWTEDAAARFFLSVAEIVEQNRDWRDREQWAKYQSFDHLLAFADLWNGDYIAYAQADDGTWLPGLILWDHETDRREELPFSLWEFIGRFNKNE